MKKKITTLLALAALAIPASAATYTLSAGTGVDAFGIQDFSGRAFRDQTAVGATFNGAAGGTSAGPGVVAFGIFSTDALSTFTSTQLVSAFTNFGDVSGTFSAVGTSGNRGVFSLSSTAAVAATSFAGKAFYLFAGNGTTLANSTQYFVFKSTTLFGAADDNNPAPIDVAITPTSGTVLFGSLVADMKTTSGDATVTPGFRMAVAVPEPSAVLLGAVGALGLLRRRRN